MKIATIVWIIIILTLLGSGWYVSRSTPARHLDPDLSADTIQNSESMTTPSAGTSAQMESLAPTTTTVIYGPNGFSPATITIKKGDTVTFLNQGGDEMWVASGPHPTHEGYSGTTKSQHCPDTAGVAFDQCSVGTTYSFTFQKTGTWGYHNHGNASDKGIVIVK
ncbi:MAG: hypothetical protein NT108_03335 [Candidatus Kaiserbacteria bacterium]|nr:hypothetical protein [Candidatus Kaiserbacteria bacterium]